MTVHLARHRRLAAISLLILTLAIATLLYAIPRAYASWPPVGVSDARWVYYDSADMGTVVGFREVDCNGNLHQWGVWTSWFEYTTMPCS